MGSVPEKMKVTDLSKIITIGNDAKGYDVFSIHQGGILKYKFLYYAYPARWVLGIRYWPEADQIELLKLSFTREAAVSLFTVKRDEIVEVLDKEHPEWRLSFGTKPLYFDVRRRKCPSSTDFTISFPSLSDEDDSVMMVNCEDKTYNPNLDTLYGIWSRGDSNNTSVTLLFLYKLYFAQYFCLPTGISPRPLGKAVALAVTEKFFMNRGYPQVYIDKTDGLPELYSDLKEPRDAYRRETPTLDAIATTITTSQLFLPKGKLDDKSLFIEGTIVDDKEDGLFLSELIEMGVDNLLQAIKKGESLHIEVDVMTDDIESITLTEDKINIIQRENSKITFDEFKSILDTDNILLSKRESSNDDDEDAAYNDYMTGMGYKQLDG